MPSKLSRSSVKPAEHVGEQIAGGAGCLAWAGRGGIAGGATGGELGGALAQAVSRSASSASVRLRSEAGFVCGILGLLDFVGTAALFSPGRSLGLLDALGNLASVERKIGAGDNGLAPLPSGQQQGQGERDGEGAGDHGAVTGCLIFCMVFPAT